MSADTIPVADLNDLPACHAQGAEPEGYDGDEKVCHNCVDKFTCLPAAADNPQVWTSRGCKTWSVEDDFEVASVLAGDFGYKAAIARMAKRQRLIDADKLIAEDLLVSRKRVSGLPIDAGVGEVAAVSKAATVTAPLAVPLPEIESEPERKEDDVKKPSSKNGSKKKAPKALAKANGKAKPQRAKKAPKPKTAKARKSAAPPKMPRSNGKKKPASVALRLVREELGKVKVAKAPRVGPHPVASNGKPLPVPGVIDEEGMTLAMARIKLGKEIDFEVGYVIRRESASGIHTVTLVDNGFLYSGDKQIYPSLSGCSQIASGTPNRSGNDYYNLVTSRCTQVLDAKGRLVADHSSN